MISIATANCSISNKQWGSFGATSLGYLGAKHFVSSLFLIMPVGPAFKAKSTGLTMCCCIMPFSDWGRCIFKVRSYNSSLGPLRSRVAFEAVDKFFKRHVKAADKPLRPDQLLRVRIEMPSRPLLGSVGLTRESIINHLPYAIAMVLIARV